jgi:hypothetical protein
VRYLKYSASSADSKQGKYWKGITKIISSHAKNEGDMFVNPAVKDEATLSAYYLSGSFGNNSQLDPYVKRAGALYAPMTQADTVFKRAAKFVTETSFTCHSRAIADAYKGKIYSVVYAVGTSTHGSDQCGTFLSGYRCTFTAGLTKEQIEQVRGFQGLLVSFLQTGDPNTLRNKEATIEWPLTTGFGEGELENVLWINDLGGKKDMEVKKDPLQNKERCAFWTEGRQAIEKSLMG